MLVMKGAKRPVKAIAFSPDGQTARVGIGKSTEKTREIGRKWQCTPVAATMRENRVKVT
jgi:hypothetical protein